MNHYDKIKQASARMIMNLMDVEDPMDADVEFYKHATLAKNPEYTQKVAEVVMQVCEGSSEPNSLLRNFVDVTRKQAAQGHTFSQKVLADITDSFFKVAGVFEVDFQEAVREAQNCKEAGVRGAGAFASALGRLGIGAAPGLVRTLMAGGAGLGVGLGGLHWMMNRDTRQDREDVEVLRAKIDAHDRLQRELKNELGRKGLMPSEEQNEETYV